MPPKKSSKPAAPTAADFSVGDIVLTKIKGYPEWPGKIVDASTAPEATQRQKAGRPFCVRFYPDADYFWAYPKELRQLTPKIIDAYLSEDSKKKQGKLRQGYEIAKDPSEWEAEQAKKDAAAQQEPEEEEQEDVDMLDDDADTKTGAGKKRKRTASEKEPKAAKAKKEAAPKAKKEPAAKKRKTDDKPQSAKAAKETKQKSASAAAGGEEDGSEEEKTVKNWRALLQRAFLTKGYPESDQMPKYDTTFKEMESFDMQPQWLASSKLGKVLKKMAALTEEIPREAEFKIKERANALMEQWKGMLNKEPSAAPATGSGDAAEETSAPAETNAGDLTVMQEDEEKKEEAPEKKEDAAPAPGTNGVDGRVNAEGQTNGDAQEEKPVEESKKEEAVPVVEGEKKIDSADVKENGTDTPVETTA